MPETVKMHFKLSFNDINWVEEVELPDNWSKLSETEHMNFLQRAKEYSLMKNVRCQINDYNYI